MMKHIRFYFTLILFTLPLSLLAVKKDAPANGPVFIKNVGQITLPDGTPRHDIDFKLKAPGIDIFIAAEGLHYQWTKPTAEGKTEVYRLDMTLEGANPDAEIVTEEHISYSERYYTTTIKGANAPACKKITYRNIYPGIDRVIYIKGNQTEYDFILHGGANPANIKMRYHGADSILLNAGGLNVYTPFGKVNESAPHSFDAGTGAMIVSEFTLKDNLVSFDINTDGNAVVIDPAINWGSYFGGSGNDAAYAVKTDRNSNIYVVGGTSSTNNIATFGAHQTTLQNTRDAYVLKMLPDGSRAWATYFGGNGTDEFLALDIDNAGNIYPVGVTKSTNVAYPPTVEQSVYGGNGDGLVTKFNSSGVLQWSRYYGGADYDSLISVAVENNAGMLYVGGRSASTYDVATFGNPLVDNEDAIIAKLRTGNGNRIWGFYHKAFNVAAICCDSKNFYIAGTCYSSIGIATPGAHQPQIGGGGRVDAYLAKYDSSGKAAPGDLIPGPLWGTYYGAAEDDGCNAMIMDDTGNLYIAGSAISTTTISTPGVYQTAPNGGEDAFIAKFRNNGQRVWGTYYGGEAQDGVYGMAFDGSGNIYITGETVSKTGISTPISHQHNFGGGANDAFIAQFTNDGTQLKWGTYYGGNSDDDGRSLTYNIAEKAAYLCGITKSASGISTTDGLQPAYGLNGDGYIASFTADSPYVYVDRPFNDTVFCVGDSFDLAYTAVEMQLNNLITVQLSDANGSFAAPTTIGSAATLTSGTIRCRIPITVAGGGKYRVRIRSSNPSLISEDNGTDIRIDKFATKPEASNNSPICEGQKLQFNLKDHTPEMTVQWSGPGAINTAIPDPSIATAQRSSDTGTYIVNINLGACEHSDTTHVDIRMNPPVLTLDNNSPVCEEDTLRLYVTDAPAGMPLTYKWTGPASFNDTAKEPTKGKITLAHTGIYKLETTLGICSTESETEVFINEAPDTPVVKNSGPLIAGEKLELTANSNTAGVTYSWIGPDNFTSNEQNPVIDPAYLDGAGTYTVTVVLGVCSATKSTDVIIEGDGNIQAYPNPSSGRLTILGSVNSGPELAYRVANMSGNVVQEGKLKVVKRLLNDTIILPAYLPAGNYTLQIELSPKERKSYPFVLIK